MKRLVGLAAILALTSATTVFAQAAGAAGPAAAPAAGAVNPPAASTGPASDTPAARTNPLTPSASTSSATGVDAAAPPAAGAVNPPLGANATTTTPGANAGVGANASTSSDTVIGNTPAGQAPSAYPPCTTRAQDRCTQKGAGRALKSRPAPASGAATTG